jgi:serine/threonine protein kinase
MTNGEQPKGSKYWKVDRVMGEGAFSRVWSATEVLKVEGSKPSSSTLLVPSHRTNGRDEKEEETYRPVDDKVVAIKMMDKRMCKENDRTRISFVREVAVLRVSPVVDHANYCDLLV